MNQQGALAHLLPKKLLILTGKGGVGKTVLSAGLALAAQRAGKRVLAAEVRAPRRLPALFGVRVEGDTLQELAPGLSWINFTAEQALQVYAMRLLRLRTVYRAVFEQKAVRRFLKAVPSLSEILILGHLHFLIENADIDLVVLDAPSTGPGALMLEAPQAVIETSPPGPLRDGAAWINDLLLDPDRTAVNLVVLPEELPVSEAVDLYHRLRDGCGVPLGVALINRLLPDPFADQDLSIVEAIGSHPLGDGLGEASQHYLRRLRQQEVYLDRLRAGVPLPDIRVPEIFEPRQAGMPHLDLRDTFCDLLGVGR